MNKHTWPYVIAGLVPAALIIFFKTKHNQMVSPGIRNLKAFLVMIQYSEGTYGVNAYRTFYGGDTFSSFAAHPDIAVTKGGITSTAAGAYQILFGTWETLRVALNLPDFSPLNQDRAAIELIRRRGALDDVLSGRFATAIEKCRKEWASLPEAGYGQREQNIQTLTQVYQRAGGQIAA